MKRGHGRANSAWKQMGERRGEAGDESAGRRAEAAHGTGRDGCLSDADDWFPLCAASRVEGAGAAWAVTQTNS